MQNDKPFVFTGERFHPEISGNIELEHMHRYIYALAYAAGKTILDIASGEGYGSALLASRAAFVIGVDIAEDAVAHASKKYQLNNLEFRQGACSQIPLQDSAVDLVVSFETIEHHDDHDKMLAEIKRVLKPDGMVIASSPDKAIYSEKPNYRNPFHVKELYKTGFEALFQRNFKNVVCLGQKVMFGSAIVPDIETATGTVSADLKTFSAAPGLREAMYNLVLASDAALPSAPVSLLEGSGTEKDVLVAQKDAIRDALIAQKDALFSQKDALIVQKDALIAQKDALIAGKDAKIIELTRHMRQRDAAIAYISARFSALSRSNSRIRPRRFGAAKPLLPAGVSPDALDTVRHSAFFDGEFYLKANPDVAAAGVDPAAHYILRSGLEGRDPGPCFSTREYLDQNPDVAAAGTNALVHYELWGPSEGRHLVSMGLPTPGNYSEKIGGGIVSSKFRIIGDILRRFRKRRRAARNADARSRANAFLNEIEPVGREFVPLFRGKPANNKRAKLVCFYLPQFHAIPENDAWWGKGFTEWTNVRAAQPQFKDHYQPRVPGELEYYNLLDPAVQRRQIELAKLYGVEGFCFYLYWFGGKRLLERPIENYLNDRTLDLPFCLCWANENWTRRWDGRDNEILVAQSHSPEDDLAFIRHVAPYMLDARYIRVNGKPLLIVYRPNLLPSPKETAKRWRAWCRSNGIGNIYLAYVQSFEQVDPAQYGFDIAIEFPPNAVATPNITDQVVTPSKDNTLVVYDWREFVYLSESYNKPKYKLLRGVCPGWDNSPRRKKNATIFTNNTPALYRRWLDNAIRDTRKRHAEPDQQLIFVNAWNEWGEGAYLEPDADYGYAFLQATRDAVCGVESQDEESILLVTHDCHANGAQFLFLAIAKRLKFDGFRVAIIALDGGKLQADFAQVGRMINVKEAGEAGVQDFLASLKASGARDAITSTVVSGSIVPQLKKLGFRVLSLVHELPDIIRNMRQEGNAASIAQLADKVVFPAEFVHRRFGEIASVSADKVVIRPQGLLRKNPYKNRNAEAYRIICERHGLPADTQIVLSVAYADLRKGPDLFVEIAARVLRERPNTTFIWVGGFHGEMEEKVTRRVHELGLQRQLLFIGFDREPMAYYAAASAYALPSREDPFPNVVLESAEVGVPVVAFVDATGAAEFITRQGGRLARYLDTEDFARQICELLVGPAKQAPNGVPSLQQYTLDLLHHLDGYPRISVIVPNFNYARHLTARLDSIFHQNFPIYEVIVLDDASSDKSVEVTEAYFARTANDGRLIVNEHNSGSVFRQWQKGVASCNGDIVWIAEADDLANINFLRELASSFQDPDIVLAFSQSKQVDEDGNVLAQNYLDYTKDISDRWRKSYVNDGRDEISDSMVIKNTIPNVSAVLFRRKALETALADIGDDLFDYRIAGDWLVYLHVLLQGKVYYNEKSLNLHRRHSSSVTNALDASRHLEEVCRLQEIGKSLSAPSRKTLTKADAYIEKLRGHFAIVAKS